MDSYTRKQMIWLACIVSMAAASVILLSRFVTGELDPVLIPGQDVELSSIPVVEGIEKPAEACVTNSATADITWVIVGWERVTPNVVKVDTYPYSLTAHPDFDPVWYCPPA